MSEQALTAQLVTDGRAYVNEPYWCGFPKLSEQEVLTAPFVKPQIQFQQEKHFLKNMQWNQRAL